MPQDWKKPEVGQQYITHCSLRLDKKKLEAQKMKKPRLKYHTNDNNGVEKKIKRWDPRTVAKKVSSLALAGSVGEYVDWASTMTRVAGNTFKSRYTALGSAHGWTATADGGEYRWSPSVSEQFSPEAFVFRRELVSGAGDEASAAKANRPNAISLQACRLLTVGILARGLHPVSQRQACLISDQIFNRAGAVPGILDALVVKGDLGSNLRAVPDAYAEFDRQGMSYTDVKKELLKGHEWNVSQNCLVLDLLSGEKLTRADLNLKTLEISDPYPGSQKVLWIRLCRAGDGHRVNFQIPCDGQGNLSKGDILFDMPTDVVGSSQEAMESQLQMCISKSEFVNCLITSPLLSETLRQLSTGDNSTKGVPTGAPLKLEVTIADPSQDEADDDILDSLNVRQSVLLEIWDRDAGSLQDDFLGECWLPPLSSIGHRTKRLVLTVQTASTDPGSTRPEQVSSIAGGLLGKAVSKKAQHLKAEGNLTVEVSWKMPAEDVPDLPESATLEQRVKQAEQLHTGQLKLKIVKASNLRSADSNKLKSGGCDPYVTMYVRNDAISASDAPSGAVEKGAWGFDEHGWHQNQVNKKHKQFMVTKVKKGTRSPVWDEEQEFVLQTGAFERRVHSAYHLHMSTNAAQRRQDDYNRAVLGGKDTKEELRIVFNSSASDDKDAKKKNEVGSKHKVQVYMGENMHQFKDKVVQACKEERDIILQSCPKRPVKDSRGRMKDEPDMSKLNQEMLKKLTQLEGFIRNCSYRHVVMVFVPSTDLHRLFKQQKQSVTGIQSYEYRRLFEQEQNDPSSWQPLDPVCPFSHYQYLYSFGRTQQRLRISDATDQYRQSNNRLRLFEQQQKQYADRLEDLNSEQKCFGYAQYVHEDDFETTEWRPVEVFRQTGGTKKKFQVNFVHTPLLQRKAVPDDRTSSPTVGPGQLQTATLPPPPPAVETSGKIEVDEDSVVLAPANPKILMTQHTEHKELLARAKVLKDRGMEDAKIVKALNDELNRSFAKSRQEDQSQQIVRPPALTLSDVQAAVKQSEDAELEAPPTDTTLVPVATSSTK